MGFSHIIPFTPILSIVFPLNRKSHKHALMRRQLAAFRDFHLRIRTASAAGPRHDVVALIDLAAFKALLQEGPDGFVVLGAEREIAAAPFEVAEFLNKLMRLCGLRLAAWSYDRHFVVGTQMFGKFAKLSWIIPIHPIAKSLRLFRLASCKPEDSSLAFVDEVVDAVFMDGGLCAKSQLLFNFNFDPKSLAIEAVLVSLIMAGHCEETLIGIFVRAAPGMVNAHWVIGSDGPVEKAPSLATRVFASQLLKRLLLKPELQNGMFASNKIAVRDGLKHEIQGPGSV